MNASLSRWLISISTVLLIVLSYLMIVLTSPSMLVGFEASEPIDLIIERQEEQSVGVICLNTATVQELMTLPNLGEVLANRIVDHRERYGPFTAVEELLNVDGVGETRLSQWEPYLTI